MSKYRLEWEDEEDFIALGISSHQKDYRIAWEINKALHCELSRVSDYIGLVGKKSSSHAYFRWDEAGDHYSYFLIGNRGTESYLLPELKQADYVFIIQGMTDLLDIDQIKSAIKNCKTVLTAFEIDRNMAKSIQNIVIE